MLLIFRKNAKIRAELDYYQSLTSLNDVIKKIESLENKINASHSISSQNPILTAIEISAYKQSLRQKIKEEISSKSFFQKNVEKKKNSLNKAMQQLKAVENFRDKKREDWETFLQENDYLILDELAITHYRV
jgi:flagellar export protein FliJ